MWVRRGWWWWFRFGRDAVVRLGWSRLGGGISFGLLSPILVVFQREFGDGLRRIGSCRGGIGSRIVGVHGLFAYIEVSARQCDSTIGVTDEGLVLQRPEHLLLQTFVVGMGSVASVGMNR